MIDPSNLTEADIGRNVHRFEPIMRSGEMICGRCRQAPCDDIHMIPARFKLFDRVRIKFGSARGCYGTIASQSGDHGHYYGVKCDCDQLVIGYSDYELEKA